MGNLNYMTPLDGELSAFISLQSRELNAGYWLINVKLFYEGKEVGTTSFTLQGYNQEEAENIVKNFKENAYLMKEIDDFLWGESD